MKSRTPPKLATWLLERFAAGRYSESLSGDITEEYSRGRGRLWYWRQVMSVLVVSLVGTVHGKILTAVFCVGYVCCEFAVVMGCIGIADQWRHAHSIKDALSLPIVFSVLFLSALAWFGFYLMKWARRFRQNLRTTE